MFDELQRCVNYLEDYKRRLGRQYDKTKSIHIAEKYNRIEDNIRHICSKYPQIMRKSKSYKLEVK